jgi:glycosyltransferase involved in cell wall biosynthesis
MFIGFDRVVVLTDADRDSLHRIAPTLPIVVIPNGVRVPSGSSKTDEQAAPRLLFFGDFGYEPNIDAATRLIQDILPRVRHQVPEASVQIAGPRPPEALRRLAASDVEVAGWLPDLAPVMERAACMVAPLRLGAGMKNKILEAMAAGLPVVTTPMGCDGLAVRDGEHVLVGSSAADLADATVRVLVDPRLRHRLGDAARRYVREHHAWEDVAARYERLYRDVIAERGVSR